MKEAEKLGAELSASVYRVREKHNAFDRSFIPALQP
jgi:hypothetical protein